VRIHNPSQGDYNFRKGIHALPFSTLIKTLKRPFRSNYPQNPVTIGDHIRKRRIDLRMLQKEVANIIGVSEDCLANWENDKNIPQIQFMPQIIKFWVVYQIR